MTEQQERNWIKVFKLRVPKLSNERKYYFNYNYINRLFYLNSIKNAYLFSATYPGPGNITVKWYYPRTKNKKQTSCFLYAVLHSHPIAVEFSCVDNDGKHMYIETQTEKYLL